VRSHAHNVSYAKEQDLWRNSNRREQQQPQQQQQQQQQYSNNGSSYYQHETTHQVDYKHRFDNLQIDGKCVQLEELDDNIDSWHNRRRFRARSESESQDYYYYRERYHDEDIRAKRTRETDSPPALKDRRTLPSTAQRLTSTTSNNSNNNVNHNHHNVTNNNPKNNFSVLVNNPAHYRYSPKSKARSFHAGHKAGMVRVSSPSLHKARVQMWKSQLSSSMQSTESVTASLTETGKDEDLDEDDDDDCTDDEEEPPMLYGPGDQVIDDEMTDPEDNYESSLSLSSSNRSLATINGGSGSATAECVHGGKVLQAPFAPSLFPFVPPYITFANFDEQGPAIPAVIHKQLKWKLTSITPLLVRKVLMNTGFRLMKSELDNLNLDARVSARDCCCRFQTCCLTHRETLP